MTATSAMHLAGAVVTVGAAVAPRPIGTVTGMGWHLDEFSRSLTAAAPSTVEAYARDLRAFTTWAGRLGLDAPAGVDRRTLRRYLAYMATRGQARRTIARRASALRRYFGWLVRTGRLDRDPTAGLSAPKGDARLPRVLRPDELRALLDDRDHTATPASSAGAGTPHGAVELRDTALLELLYGSGLRIAEATALDVDEIDLARARVVVWGKGAKQRTVPLSEPAVDAVRRWLADGRSALATAASPGARCSSTSGAAGSHRATPGASSTGVRSSPHIRTRCATRSQRTCSTGALTCESCKSSSAIQTWRPPSVTLTSRRNG